MEVVKKIYLLNKPGVGMIAFIKVRKPFSFFSRWPERLYFKPDFSGAGWYRIQPSDLDEEFDEKTDAASAMAYLRSRYEDFSECMVKF